MSGLLIGILLARTVSGVVADVAGWRAVYVLAALAIAALAVALHHMLPTVPPKVTTSYGALLRSVASLVRHEPTLRLRMGFGALGMGTFTVFWTALTFLLSAPPFDYSDAAIGLFGLAGLVGALTAQGAGRLFDRGLGRTATGVFWIVVAGSWVLCDLGATAVVPLILGALVLDAGVQGQHILNQSTIYALAPEARSRVTTAYMAGNFVTAAVASAAAAAVWSAGGWDGVCLLGGGLSLAAVALWAVSTVRARRAEAVPAPAPSPR
jgi:predicted MFS family arabinose efflux permease